MGGGEGGSVNDIHITKSSRIYSRESAMDTVTKIMLNITLTSAIVTGFCVSEKSGTLFTLVLFRFFCNVGMYLVGFVISIRKGRAKKALYTLNMPGYNVLFLPAAAASTGHFALFADHSTVAGIYRKMRG
ncbi:hypothetical protein EUCA11A_11640 [Eubacterium callanderi]|nr:hypothetical protein EUCA2A_11640 [Eubacterium callanderi]WPK71309.1 hypothetical protein EUCA11A_11640 [Eubacterium callanderi]